MPADEQKQAEAQKRQAAAAVYSQLARSSTENKVSMALTAENNIEARDEQGAQLIKQNDKKEAVGLRVEEKKEATNTLMEQQQMEQERRAALREQSSTARPSTEPPKESVLKKEEHKKEKEVADDLLKKAFSPSAGG